MAKNRLGKHKFLVVDDYGMGGLWAFIYANSKEEITDKYPELKIVEKIPAWMDGESLKIVERNTFDIDEEPGQWLSALIAERENSK